MQKAFDKILKGLLPEGETALLAVSGGVDSMCMAELFRSSMSHPRFAVAHCNFHLRGEDSDSDASLVRQWAEDAGVPFHQADFDTEEYAASHSMSIEMAARELRYDWFARLCKDNGYYGVSVAHNANDNAETLVLNLLRGTGLRGISGMKEMSEVAVSSDGPAGVRLFRPLLGFTREQITGFARQAALTWHEDFTNAETVYKRNKIRNLVFPLFESINPSFLRTFSREMGTFAQENAIADDYFNAAAAKVNASPLPGEFLRVNVRLLRQDAHWEYVLYRLLEPFGFRDRQLDPIIRLVRDGEIFSGREFGSQGYRIVTTDNHIVVKKRAASSGLPFRKFSGIRENDVCAAVPGAGTYEFASAKVNVRVESIDGDVVGRVKELASSGAFSADVAALTFPFLLRHWRSGDWMRPIGAKGRKKLSDMFKDMKLSIDEKAEALVVVAPHLNKGYDETKDAGEHVAGVCGYASGKFYCRVDEAVKALQSTDSLVVIEL